MFASVSVETRFASAVGAVVGLPQKKRLALAVVQASHCVATYQLDAAVLAAISLVTPRQRQRVSEDCV